MNLRQILDQISRLLIISGFFLTYPPIELLLYSVFFTKFNMLSKIPSFYFLIIPVFLGLLFLPHLITVFQKKKIQEIGPPLLVEPPLSSEEILQLKHLKQAQQEDENTLKTLKYYRILKELKKDIKRKHDPITFEEVATEKAIFLLKMYLKNKQQKIVPGNRNSFISSQEGLPILEKHGRSPLTNESYFNSKNKYHHKEKSYPICFFYQKFDIKNPHNTYEIHKLTKDIRKSLKKIES